MKSLSRWVLGTMSPKPTVVMDTTQKYSESAAAGGTGDGS